MRGRKSQIRLRHPVTGLYYGGRGYNTYKLVTEDRAIVLTSHGTRDILPRLKKRYGVDFIKENTNVAGNRYTVHHPSESGAASFPHEEGVTGQGDVDEDRRML